MLLSYRYRNGDPHVTCCCPIGTVMETLTLLAAILSVAQWRTSPYMLLSYRYRNGDPYITCCYPIGTVMENLTLHAVILSVP
jgi:hypothetical protein